MWLLKILTRWISYFSGLERARAAPEQEFLSSTSPEVYEVWTGHEIVRMHDKLDEGAAQYLVIAHPVDTTMETRGQVEEHLRPMIQDVTGAANFGLLKCRSGTIKQQHAASLPPCITLNVPGAVPRRLELCICVLIGSLLQVSIFAIITTTTYHYQWQRRSQPIPAFAYPAFVVGSTLNCIGIFLCGQLIERSTDEAEYVWEKNRAYEVPTMIFVQLASTSAKQSFPSCVLLLDAQERILRFSKSRRNSRKSVLVRITVEIPANAMQVAEHGRSSHGNRWLRR